MLKGHARIELTDINTSSKEVIESDNIVTNGASTFLKIRGNTLHPVEKMFMENDNPVATLYGGLILWDGTIDESVNNYHKPAGVKMTANACYGLKNTTDASELGNYNTDESVIGNGYAKFVFDFSTNEGNGTIASLSLVHKYCGMIGFGNKKSGVCANLAGISDVIKNGSRNISSTEIAYQKNGNALYMKEDVLYVASMSTSTGAVIIGSYKFDTGHTLSLFSDKKNLLKNKIGSKEIQLKDYHTYSRVTYQVVGIEDKYLYYAILNTKSPYNVLLIKVDITTCSVESTDLETLYNKLHATGSFHNILNGNLVYYGKDSKCHIYNISTGDVVDVSYDTRNIVSHLKLNEKESLCFTKDGYCYLYSKEDNSYVMTNNKEATNNSPAIYATGDGGVVCAYSNGTTYVSGNPFYIGTINNLDSPVEKTADKTMKITYTLTET